ncbi:hypothetical protein ABK040_011419 [Willaertia magna]
MQIPNPHPIGYPPNDPNVPPINGVVPQPHPVPPIKGVPQVLAPNPAPKNGVPHVFAPNPVPQPPANSGYPPPNPRVFGLKWKISIYLKGNEESNNDECAIFLWLKSLQYKNENEEEKEISSIKIKYSINNINLNNNRNYEYNFIKKTGYGSYGFKQSNFIPIIRNDQQIFSIVIGMKKLDIQLNNLEK